MQSGLGPSTGTTLFLDDLLGAAINAMLILQDLLQGKSAIQVASQTSSNTGAVGRMTSTEQPGLQIPNPAYHSTEAAAHRARYVRTSSTLTMIQCADPIFLKLNKCFLFRDHCSIQTTNLMALPRSPGADYMEEPAPNAAHLGAQRSGLTPEEVAQIQESLEPPRNVHLSNPTQRGELARDKAVEMERRLEELKTLFQSHEALVQRELDKSSGEASERALGEASVRVTESVQTAREERPQVPGTGLESAWLMDENTIDALLTFYGLPLMGTGVEKRRALVEFLGARVG